MNIRNQVLITRICIFVELFNSELFWAKKKVIGLNQAKLGRISSLSYKILAARQSKSSLKLLFVKTLASTWHCWDFAPFQQKRKKEGKLSQIQLNMTLLPDFQVLIFHLASCF